MRMLSLLALVACSSACKVTAPCDVRHTSVYAGSLYDFSYGLVQNYRAQGYECHITASSLVSGQDDYTCTKC